MAGLILLLASGVKSYSASLTVAGSPSPFRGIYMGKFSGQNDSGGVAGMVRADGTALAVGYNTARDEGVFAPMFVVAANGSFNTPTLQGGTANGTFTAASVSGSFRASDGLSGNFSATRKPDTGIHQASAGYYVGTYSGVYSGSAYLLLAADGTAFFYTSSPLADGGGFGTISSGNTVSATTVPDGFRITGTLNRTTRRITGNYSLGSTTLGSYSVTWVLGPDGPGTVSPSLAISSQPLSQTGELGESLTLSVIATGAPPLTYQWRKDGASITEAVGSTLTLGNLRPDDAGAYTVAVTDSSGSLVSTPATITVIARLNLTTTAGGLVRRSPDSPSYLLNSTITLTAKPLAGFSFAGWFGDADGIASTLTMTLDRTKRVEARFIRAPRPIASRVVAWGFNGNGQTTVPVGLSNVVGIAAGSEFSLALRAAGTVVGWGTGVGYDPNATASQTNIAAIAAGSHHTLLLKSDGRVLAFGRNNEGQCNIPSGLTNAVAVAGGWNYSMALRADGTVIAWPPQNFSPPPGLNNVIAIAAGGFHCLALRANGTVVAWGYNGNGQTNVPVGLSNVAAITAGNEHSVALKADGSLAAWGRNREGQTNVPTNFVGVVAIDSEGGGEHTLALRRNGTVAAWGFTANGRTQIPADLTGATVIAAGVAHNLALIEQFDFTARLAAGKYSLGGAFEISIEGMLGVDTVVEASSNLTEWVPVMSIEGQGGSARILDEGATNFTHRFYRAVLR